MTLTIQLSLSVHVDNIDLEQATRVPASYTKVKPGPNRQDQTNSNALAFVMQHLIG